jgi:rhamnosyltransferase subunit B
MGSRIVLTTFGSLGDLHPFLAIGIELRARGHRVAIVTTEGYRDKIAAEGIDFYPMRPRVSPDDRELVAYAMDLKKGPERVLREIMLPALHDSYLDLLAAMPGADLLVTHPLTFAGPPIAQARGLRWASVALAPMGFFSAFDPPVLPLFAALAHLRGMGPWINRQVMDVGRRIVLPWTEPVRQLRAELGLPPGANPVFEGQHSPHLVLALFSSVLGAPQPDWPPHATVTGFVFHDRHEGVRELSPELDAFLRGGEAPLVFTLGSAAVLTPGRFFAESAAAAQSLGCRAVLVGLAAEERPAAFPESIFALRYAPFSRLFPRAAAIVHQGGIGTTGQALAAGLPMLVVPFSHDQPDNAARLVRLGVARTLGRARYTAPRAAAALRRLLDDRGYAERAARIGTRVRAERGLDNACTAIEHLLPSSPAGSVSPPTPPAAMPP